MNHQISHISTKKKNLPFYPFFFFFLKKRKNTTKITTGLNSLNYGLPCRVVGDKSSLVQHLSSQGARASSKVHIWLMTLIFLIS